MQSAGFIQFERMTTILSIQSQVVAARVGNSVAAFAMQRLGARVLALPTTQFGRRPDKGSPGGGPVPAEVMASLLDAVEADGALPGVDVVLTGYMAHPEQVAVAKDAVDRVRAANPRALVVCDPVMGEESKGLYVRAETADAIAKTLAPIADLLTPNAFEASQLMGGVDATNLTALHNGALSFGKAMAITSAPIPGATGVLYVARTGAWLVETPKLAVTASGAGDLFTALFTARRALGQSLVVALEAAVGSVHDVLVRTLMDGGDDLAVVAAQDKLEYPDLWPTAKQYRPTE